jgi:hypothetical protein
VPWTKPADVHYNANNPLSSLVESGPNLVPTFADGSVRPQGPLTPGQLKALITRNGGEDPQNPPVLSPAAAVYVHQTAGNTKLNEFGADAFDVVLDAAPSGNVTVNLSVSNPAAAALDKAALVFTTGNWNKPQRVYVRGVDDHEVNADRTVDITVAAPGYGASQIFSAKIVNDDLPALRADFNDDALVDGHDFLAWQRSVGMGINATRAQGDADADTDVDQADLTAWKTEFGGLAAAPSADFDGNGQVNGADLAAWRGGFGTATNAAFASGDADLDHDVDGADFLAWQRAFLLGGGAAGNAANGASAATVMAGAMDMLSGLPQFAVSIDAAEPSINAAAAAQPASIMAVRDWAFASSGGVAAGANGAWDMGVESGGQPSAMELEASIDECLGAALGEGWAWRHFWRPA